MAESQGTGAAGLLGKPGRGRFRGTEREHPGVQARAETATGCSPAVVTHVAAVSRQALQGRTAHRPPAARLGRGPARLGSETMRSSAQGRPGADTPRISISSYHLIPTQALLVRLNADALNAPISDIYLVMTT